jgi:hypothetical protein
MFEYANENARTSAFQLREMRLVLTAPRAIAIKQVALRE